ncbi:MAG TPA: ATP-binding protein [Candidatus Competibacteraceae bacterium]|nr:ATP-binding protein [Candidatus Competibacteraceae bacterium]HPF59023.1 ATP-binding protein [Candidatus Competibacteraceae bacterium]HRY19354.1 ATP-binding protein [Candidatus Competibacteraceae bacterium]
MMSENSNIKITRLCLPAELDHLSVFLDHIREIAQTAGLAEAQISRLELAMEEALVNVFNYAYEGRTHAGTVFCQVTIQAGGLTVDIVDDGPPFDPLARTDPDTSLELDERQPGGLGILLIKSLIDEVSYHREDGRNVLSLRITQAVHEG